MRIPLFDIDWTLLKGGNKAHDDAFDFAFRSVYGVNASKREIVTEGMIDPQIICLVLKLHNVPIEIIQEKIPEAVKAMEQYFLGHIEEGEYVALSGVHDMLSELRKLGIPAGVLTGNIEGIGWKKLEKAGLGNLIDFGAFGDLAEKRVDLVNVAWKRLDERCKIEVPKTDLVIVGDSLLDIACAKEAGIPVIAVASGIFSLEELKEAGPDLVVESLRQKEEILPFLRV